MTTPLKAIILAAGEGNRLRPYTADRPKCMVELGGRSLLEHQVGVLRSQGIKDITIVTGYLSEKITALGYKTVHNPEFNQSNMVFSLMCAKEEMDGTSDILVAYSDILYEPQIIRSLVHSHASISTTVDLNWMQLWQARNEEPLLDAETLQMDGDHFLLELGKKPESMEEIEAQYMGLIGIKSFIAPEIVESYQQLDSRGIYDGKDKKNMYMTSFLQHFIDQAHPIMAVPIRGGWLEVDTKEDLELYNQMHEEGTLSKFYSIQLD